MTNATPPDSEASAHPNTPESLGNRQVPRALTLHLKAVEGSHTLEIAPVTLQTYSFFTEILTHFGEVVGGQLKITSVQQATTELKEKLSAFVDVHRKNIPALNKLSSFVRKIPDNEWFMVLNEGPVDTRHLLHVDTYLVARNKTATEDEAQQVYEQMMEKTEREYGPILDEYNLSVLDSSKRSIIGNKLKIDRECRFCGGKFIDGIEFTQKAHAISESLGNKGIVLGDECDSCNTFFGEEIEPHLIEMLSIQRAFLGTEGKSGIPQMTFSNAKVENIGGVMTVIATKPGVSSGDPYTKTTLSLDSNFNFIPINMYKAFCKISLSTIDDAELKHLKSTIEWLRYGFHPETRVPLVARAVVHEGFMKTPQIANYIRKNDNHEFPHIVSEFRLGSWVYVFVVPLSAKDKNQFLDTSEFENFWKLFQHYKNADWLFESFNGTTSRKLTMNLSIHATRAT